MKRLKTIAFSINHQRIRSCEDKRKSRLRKVHQIRRTNTLTGQSNLHSCIFTRLSSETGRGWFACEQDATTRSNMIEDATKKKKKRKNVNARFKMYYTLYTVRVCVRWFGHRLWPHDSCIVRSQNVTTVVASVFHWLKTGFAITSTKNSMTFANILGWIVLYDCLLNTSYFSMIIFY